MIAYGLALHFHDSLLKNIECECFVTYFDESLNESSQSQQMDIVVGAAAVKHQTKSV